LLRFAARSVPHSTTPAEQDETQSITTVQYTVITAISQPVLLIAAASSRRNSQLYSTDQQFMAASIRRRRIQDLLAGAAY